MEHDLEFLIEDFYNKITSQGGELLDRDGVNDDREDYRDSPSLQELAYKHYAC